MDEIRLSDLGERRILQEIIPRFASGTGDDCAVIPVGGGFLVATTDPVPTPAAHVIAGETDPYWVGWLLVTINASDIAASGATSSAFLAAFDMPRDWPVAQLERLMLGVKESCIANEIAYVGGNIREAEKFSAVGFGLGFSKSKPLTRSGANTGDRLFVFGRSGLFWSDVLEFQAGRSLDRMTSPLYRPVSQVGVIHELHSYGLISCAMDTSDGLAPTLEELSKKNDLGILVDTSKIRYASANLTSLERPERLWMGWGDWTIAAVVKPEACDAVRELCGRKGYIAFEIGEFSEDLSGVFLRDGDRSLRLGRLESERFAKDSWFYLGVNAYEAMLRSLALP